MAGVPFTTLSSILPFILIGIGVDDMVRKSDGRLDTRLLLTPPVVCKRRLVSSWGGGGGAMRICAISLLDTTVYNEW